MRRFHVVMLVAVIVGPGLAAVLEAKTRRKPHKPPAAEEAAEAAPAPASAARETPPRTAEQQAILDRLIGHLGELNRGIVASEEQTQLLAADLAGLASGRMKPTAESLRLLATDLATLLAASDLSARETARVAADIETVLSSAGAGRPDQHRAAEDARDIFMAAGPTWLQAERLANDLRAIASGSAVRARGSEPSSGESKPARRKSGRRRKP